MAELPQLVVAWVEDTRRLFRYALVTTGPDAGMAYDVSMMPMDEPPASGEYDEVSVERVRDHAELTTKVRTRLGLSRKTTKIVVQAAMWRYGGMAVGGTASLLRGVGIPVPRIKGGASAAPEQSWREYRYPHPKYTG